MNISSVRLLLCAALAARIPTAGDSHLLHATDARNAPVTGAVVDVWLDDTAREEHPDRGDVQLHTDEFGLCLIEDSSAEGLVRVHHDTAGASGLARLADLVPGRHGAVAVSLGPLLEVNGVVRRGDGTPAAGASVQARVAEYDSSAFRPQLPAGIRTDAQGAFSFTVEVQVPLTLWAQDSDLRSRDASWMTPLPQGIELRLPGAYVVTGILEAPEGVDLDGVPVEVETWDELANVESTLDADGRFELVFPFLGEYELRFGEFYHWGGDNQFFVDDVAGMRIAEPVIVRLTDEDPGAEVVARLVPPARFAGRVAMSSGAEVPKDLIVSADCSDWQPQDTASMTWSEVGGTHTVAVQDDGSFEFTTLHPDCVYDIKTSLVLERESFTGSASKSRMLARSKGVPADTQDFVVTVDDTLVAPQALRGQVVDSSGRAVQKVSAQLFRYDVDPIAAMFRGRAQQRGPSSGAIVGNKFRFGMPHDIPESLFENGGQLLAVFTAPDMGQAYLGPLDRAGLAVPHVVVLPPRVLPAVTVRDARGAPAQAAQVRIFGPALPFDESLPALRQLRSGATDADGGFAGKPFSAGIVSLHVHSEEGEAMLVIDAREGWPDTVAVDLEESLPDARVTLTLVDPIGQPLDGFQVGIRRDCPGAIEAEVLTATADPTGRVTFPDLRPGVYGVRAGLLWVDQPYVLEVHPGSDEEHTLVVP